MILVIDDCPLILMQWRRLLGDQVVTVETVAELEALADRYPEATTRAAFAVVDYYFAYGWTGERVARHLGQNGFTGSVLFASDAPEGALSQEYERLPKNPLDAWAHLASRTPLLTSASL